MTWFLLIALFFDWWNSSVAAGGALLTAQELRLYFNELTASMQKETSMLRTELGMIAEGERRSRDEIRQELAGIRREIIAVLLHGRGVWGEGGTKGGWGGTASLAEEAANRLLRRGGGDDNESWLSSLAEKTGIKGGGGGRGTDEARGGERGDRQSLWDQGFFAGLQSQFLSQGGGGKEGDGRQGQSSAQTGEEKWKEPLPLSTDQKPQQR